MSQKPSPEPERKGASESDVSARWTHPLPEAPVLSKLAKNSFAAEQYRSLATQIELRLAHRPEKTPVLVVTSADPGCGKTLTSINLAIALARGGAKRVLLIEGDLWKPTFANCFQRDEDEPGFGALLAGEVPLAEATVSVWKANIDLLFAGKRGQSADFVAAENVEALLRRFRESYDLVLIDSPPIVLSLGRTLAACADFAVVVVRAKRSIKKRIEEALSILGPEKVVGLILNDVSLRALRYGAYGYGSYASYGAYAAYEAYEEKEAPGDSSSSGADSAIATKARRVRRVLAAALILLAAALVLGWWFSRKGVPEGRSGLESQVANRPDDSQADDVAPALPSSALPSTADEPETVSSVPTDESASVSVRLNLRSGPGLDEAVQKTLAVGAALQILEQRGDWLRVAGDAGRGWVHRSGIEFEQAAPRVQRARAVRPEESAAPTEAQTPVRDTREEPLEYQSQLDPTEQPTVVQAQESMPHTLQPEIGSRGLAASFSAETAPTQFFRASYQAGTASGESTSAPEPTVTVEQPLILVGPSLTRIQTPDYPPAARRLGLAGTVTVSVVVDEAGRAVDAQIIDPVRRLSLLNRAALDAALTAEFEPATQGGIPVESSFRLVFPFVLPHSAGGGAQ